VIKLVRLKLVTDRTFPRFYVIAGKRSICHQLFSAGCGNAGFDARLEGTAVQEIRGR
jgi:hypothetical protein